MPAGKAMEARAFQSPSRYVQGPGQIKKLPVFAKNFGETALAVIDTFFYQEYSEKIPAMDENRMEYINAVVDDVYGKRWNVSNMPQYFSRETLIDSILYLDEYAKTI